VSRAVGAVLTIRLSSGCGCVALQHVTVCLAVPPGSWCCLFRLVGGCCEFVALQHMVDGLVVLPDEYRLRLRVEAGQWMLPLLLLSSCCGCVAMQHVTMSLVRQLLWRSCAAACDW
jgi:hypothetical protein